jgi:TonB family protein
MNMPSIAFLFDMAAKSTVLLGVACLLILALRRTSAAARYFTWICAFASVLALPVLSELLPRWDLRVKTPLVGTVVSKAAATDVAPITAQRPDAGGAPVRLKRSVPWLAVIWLSGALLALARLAAGHVRLALSMRRAVDVRVPDWLAARDQAAARIGLHRAVKMKRSSQTDVPLTCGVFFATIVLPDASGEWDAERRHVVLLHELTHARRRDPLLWLMVQIAAALYWFHPLGWLALAGFRREQERSCDDAVVNAGAAGPAYAEHLVALARAIAPARAYSAALGMAATSNLEQRVRALLDRRRNRQGLRRGMCAVAAIAVVAAILPLATLRAQQSGVSPSLSGWIHDPGGAVVPGALVLLRNNNSHQDGARTNAAGEYRFSVPEGSYTMEVHAQGFAGYRKAIVLPLDGQSNVELELGSVSDSVEVVGRGPRPSETGTPRRIRVGGNVQAAKLVSMTKPVYPADAEAAGIEGTVMLQAVISAEGNLLGLSVMNTSTDASLASAAMDAVRQWHYQPTLLNGEAVEVVTTIAVTFRLQQ